MGTLWYVLHRKSLNLRGHFRGHLRVHSRVHFREHFRERVRGSNFAVRVLCACLSFGEENSLSLTEFHGKIGDFWEELGKFAWHTNNRLRGTH